MADGPLPTDPNTAWGVLAFLLTAAALAGKALEVPVKWLFQVLGWLKSHERRQEEAFIKELETHAARAVEDAMSPIRQHVAEMKRGVDGKQAVMDDKLAALWKEMRDRDERMTESLHRRVTSDLNEQRRQLTQHIDKQVDTLRTHMTDLLHTAMNGRSRS